MLRKLETNTNLIKAVSAGDKEFVRTYLMENYSPSKGKLKTINNILKAM
jgi:hypothetical protein